MPSHTTQKAETFLQKLGDFFDPRNLIQMPEYPTAREEIPDDDRYKQFVDTHQQMPTGQGFTGIGSDIYDALTGFNLKDAVGTGIRKAGQFLFPRGIMAPTMTEQQQRDIIRNNVTGPMAR